MYGETASPAAASTGHEFLSQITETQLGNKLLGPEALAVDADGNVFAGDPLGGGIDKFSSSGTFETSFGLFGEVAGLAVAADGTVYVANGAQLDVFKPVGEGYALQAVWSKYRPRGGGNPVPFVQLGGVAVDNKGEVFVSDVGHEAGYVFTPPEEPEGEPSEPLAEQRLPGAGSIALDQSSETIYVADAHIIHAYKEVREEAGTIKFEKTLTINGKTPPTPYGGFGTITGLAVEESTGDLYVADPEHHSVDQLTPTGEFLGWIVQAGPSSGLLEPRAVAVAPTSGDVYVSDTEARALDVYGPTEGVALPTVETFKKIKPARTEATLKGQINPEGHPASYYFEYGETTAYGSETEATEIPAGSTPVEVSAEVSGLTPGRTYDFRIVGENAAHQKSYGQNQSFVTPPAVEGLLSGSATNVTATSATLAGTFSPQGLATEYHFEYGETTAYGTSTPVAETSSSATPEANIEALKPNTVYHFRLLASNQFGETTGEDKTFKTAGPPNVVSGEAEPEGHGEKLNARVNPDRLATHYYFEYGETTEYGQRSNEAELPAGEELEAVSATVEEPKPVTTYHYRVVAANEAGTVYGPDQTFSTLLSEAARDLTGETATLTAVINPLGAATVYHFEFGESSSYTKVTPEADLAASEGDQLAKEEIGGLQPGRTYHFRVVAKQGSREGFGPDQTFTTAVSGGPAPLPDARSYELVTPANKHGAGVEALTKEGGAIQASEDGNSFAYVIAGAITEEPEGNRSPEPQQVLATRGESGWSSQQLTNQAERAIGISGGQLPEYQGFSSDLSLALVQPFPFAQTPMAEPPLSPPATEAERGKQEKTMYLRANPPISPGSAEQAIYAEAQREGEAFAQEHAVASAPGYLPLVTMANVAEHVKYGGTPGANTKLIEHPLEFLEATPDLSHVVLRSYQPLAPQPPSAPGLYEWAGGKLSLVSVLPNGKAAPNGAEHSELGFGFSNQSANRRHAVSTDGSRIIWTQEERNQTSLYMRDTQSHQTVQLDKPAVALPEERHLARFQIASADGSRVFFTDQTPLTPNSSASSLPLNEELFVCEIEEVAGGCKTLTDLTPQFNAGEDAEVRGAILGASEDGSDVYFVAGGVLTAGPGPLHGANNLYVSHYASGEWTTKFIARLSEEDGPDWLGGLLTKEGYYRLKSLTARVSPDGNYLAFMSNRPLTGYDNTDVYEEEVEGKPVRHADEEVFLFDYGAESLTCVSCNPTGARPRGVYDTKASGEGPGLLVDRPETWTTVPGADHWLAGSIPGYTAMSLLVANYQSHYLNDEGRLFFTSADALDPAAALTRVEEVNGNPVSVGVENVYEFEPSGVGSCASGSGCVSLISSGGSNKESAFLDATPSGNDVFILTASPLLPTEDKDSSFDIYDARVDGSAPAPPPANPCSGPGECREGEFTTPAVQPPSTLIFSAPPSVVVPKVEVESEKKAKKAKPTRAQQLAKALAKCRKLPHRTHAQKHRRAKCEAKARKKYGARKKHKHKRKKKGKKK
jgi:WD40-like Beta Propeller Repeat